MVPQTLNKNSMQQRSAADDNNFTPLLSNDLTNESNRREKLSYSLENKNISYTEQAEFEVRFKNVQMNLSFSKPEEQCSKDTTLLIIS